MAAKITNEIFLERARKVHGDKYNYKTPYIKNVIPILIECTKHGDFWQKPENHIYQKSGCPQCGLLKLSKTFSSNKETFVEKALKVHQNREYPYRYPGVYVNNRVPMEIECTLHGSWMQRPDNHLTGFGCAKCATEYTMNILRLPLMDKINKGYLIHDRKYQYHLIDEAKGQLDKVPIVCPVHGTFHQTWSQHLQGRGCRKCSKAVSKPETLWLDQLGIPSENRQIKIMRGERSKDNRKELFYRVDGIDHSTNTIYEYYGDYHHANPNVFAADKQHALFKCTYGEVYQRTLKREKFIKDSGYNLVTIWDSEFRPKNKDKLKIG